MTKKIKKFKVTLELEVEYDDDEKIYPNASNLQEKLEGKVYNNSVILTAQNGNVVDFNFLDKIKEVK